MSRSLLKKAGSALAGGLVAGSLLVGGSAIAAPQQAEAATYDKTFTTFGYNAFECEVRTKDAMKKLHNKYLMVKRTQYCVWGDMGPGLKPAYISKIKYNSSALLQ